MLNGRHKPGLLAILIAGVLPLKALANGFGLPDQDAFATARGEAFTATADNPSAIYYNPAGITQLEGNNYRSGAYGIYLDESYTRRTALRPIMTRTIGPRFPSFSSRTPSRPCR